MIRKSNLCTVAVALVVWLGALIAPAATVVSDPSFDAAAYGGIIGTVLVSKRQPDGKILVGGIFSETNGKATTGIARLNADGSIDATFNPPYFFGLGLGSAATISVIGLQSDGKIVVGGRFSSVIGDSLGNGVRRLNQDGTLDTSFTPYPLNNNDTVRDLVVQPDNKILVGGSADGSSPMLVRLQPNGGVDGTFGVSSTVGTIFGILVLPDERILISGHDGVKRLISTGAVDGSYAVVDSNNGTVLDMVLRPDGKVIIGGVFGTLNGSQAGGIALLNSDGTRDATFNAGNSGSNAAVMAVELLADGKMIIGGSFTTFNAAERQHVARLNANGTLDTAFINNPALVGTIITDVAVLNDGRVLAGNEFQSANLAAIMLNSNGSSDTSSEYVMSFSGRVRRILQLASGKILIGGQFNYVNGIRRRGLARLNADGSLDTTFVPYFNGSATTDFSITSLVELADGKLLVGGINNFFIKRLNADGSQDATFATTFGLGSTVYDLAVLPNGQIIAVGTILTAQPARRVARLESNGAFDPTFNPFQPTNDVFAVVRQPDGKLLIGGDFAGISSTPRGRIARLNENGSLDTSFDTSTGATGSVFNIALQPDGKVLVAGSFSSLQGSNAAAGVGRLNADGTLDTGFSQSIGGNVIGLALQADGKILVGGGFDQVGGVSRPRIARLNPNGSLDASFNMGTVESVLEIKPLANGKILIGGEFTRVNSRSKLRIARLQSAAVPFDFDGDGKSDVAVYRPSSGVWFELFSSNSQVGQFAFGLSGDVPAPADYDGDGKTDEAIFRPSSGDFWYLRSIDGGAVNVRWGQSGDLPRPSDFDADGRADFVLYRPSTGVWYRFGSTGQISITQFGIPGDQPVVGDFDGDGKSDLAVFRPSTGDWWYSASGFGNELRAIHWGVNGDIPSAADFDGDGSTDFAVFRPSNGGWYVYRSSDQAYTILSFGLNGDRPVAADYDGDGKADIAVFRPSNGVWYLLQSTAGIGGVQWGLASDIALPNAFAP